METSHADLRLSQWHFTQLRVQDLCFRCLTKEQRERPLRSAWHFWMLQRKLCTLTKFPDIQDVVLILSSAQYQPHRFSRPLLMSKHFATLWNTTLHRWKQGNTSAFLRIQLAFQKCFLISDSDFCTLETQLLNTFRGEKMHLWNIACDRKEEKLPVFLHYAVPLIPLPFSPGEKKSKRTIKLGQEGHLSSIWSQHQSKEQSAPCVRTISDWNNKQNWSPVFSSNESISINLCYKLQWHGASWASTRQHLGFLHANSITVICQP